MNAKRFLNEKEALINQIDLLRLQIEKITIDDASICYQKYITEEDPMGVALHELLYTQIGQMINNSL